MGRIHVKINKRTSKFIFVHHFNSSKQLENIYTNGGLFSSETAKKLGLKIQTGVSGAGRFLNHMKYGKGMDLWLMMNLQSFLS